MFQDPDQFIREKLSKKFLSINTIRDGVIAALLIALQKKEERTGPIPPVAQWRKEKSSELRQIASDAFASIDAPFEYSTLSQLKTVTDILKKASDWEHFSKQEKDDFDSRCQSLFDKFDEDD